MSKITDSARGKACTMQWPGYQHNPIDMGDRPEKKMLDRIENNGGYEKKNCRWVTNTEQSRNRSSTRIIEMDGERHCIAEWADIFNINRATLYSRLDRGLSLSQATRGIE